MKKIYRADRISEALSQSRYKELLEGIPAELFLAEYEAGELLPQPNDGRNLLQIVVEGSLSIYYMRNDGSSYSLAFSQRDDILGQMEFFGGGGSPCVFAEATKKLTCLAFVTDGIRDALMNDANFLRVLAESMAGIIEMLTKQNAASPSLKERVYSYMLYQCENKRLKGVEKAAFSLHCSPRQLQRILNAFAEAGVAKKLGKGTYELC